MRRCELCPLIAWFGEDAFYSPEHGSDAAGELAPAAELSGTKRSLGGSSGNAAGCRLASSGRFILRGGFC